MGGISQRRNREWSGLSQTESVNAGTESGLIVIFAVLLNFHFALHSSILLGTVEWSRNTRTVIGQSSRPFPEHGDYLPVLSWPESVNAGTGSNIKYKWHPGLGLRAQLSTFWNVQLKFLCMFGLNSMFLVWVVDIYIYIYIYIYICTQ